jgi:uroporphyrinogen-III synthase
MRILVVRPEPGASATAARLRALGHDPVVMPLLDTETVDWTLPSTRPDAILLTSAAAARHAGGRVAPLFALPALCVGEATAAAARAAGWRDAQAGPGTVQALLDAAATGPHRRLLHLAGEDRTAVTVPAGLHIETITSYRARLSALPTLPHAAAVLLHSPRTAAQFAAEWDRLGGRRGDVALLAISPSTLAAAGPGWQAGHSAPAPTEDALLAMLPKAL